MKDVIKTEVIDGDSFDIRKDGASLALECQSIFMTLINRNNIDQDSNTDSGLDMMSGMTKDIVKRIKDVFIDCIASPKITNEYFEELSPKIIPRLFIAVYEYQTKEAIKKKSNSNSSQDSQKNSEKNE